MKKIKMWKNFLRFKNFIIDFLNIYNKIYFFLDFK
jgi:hypothetical protein